MANKGALAGIKDFFGISSTPSTPPTLETATHISVGTMLQGRANVKTFFPIAEKKDDGWTVTDRTQKAGESTEKTVLATGLTTEQAVQRLRERVEDVLRNGGEHQSAKSKGSVISIEDAETELAAKSAPTSTPVPGSTALKSGTRNKL